MELIAIPSVLALTIKIWLFIKVKFDNRDLLLLLSGLFCLNLFELISFMPSSTGSQVLFVLQLFYIALIFVVGILLNFCARLSGFDYLTLGYPHYILASGLAITIVFTDSIVAGVQLISYSITRVPGENYWIVQVYVILGFTIALALLLHGSIKQTPPQNKKCLVILLAFLPMEIGLIVTIILMQLGFKINGTVILSCTTTFFLMVLIHTENKEHLLENLFSVLIKVPFTAERQAYKRVNSQVMHVLGELYDGHNIKLKTHITLIEKEMIETAMQLQASPKNTAENLGISVSTIERKIKMSRKIAN